MIAATIHLQRESEAQIKNTCEYLNGNFNEAEKLIYAKKQFEGTKIDPLSVMCDERFTIFHTLGKILYNKRIDPETGTPKMLSREKMLLQPKRYFDLRKLLEQARMTYENFNHYLYDNYPDHFRNIKELSSVADTFSLTDRIYSFRNNIHTNEDYKFNSLYLNCEATMCYNLSQHGNHKSTFKKYFKTMANYDLSGVLYKKNIRAVQYHAKTNLAFTQKFSSNNFIQDLKSSLRILNPDFEFGKEDKKLKIMEEVIPEENFYEDVKDPYDPQKIINEIIDAINSTIVDNLDLTELDVELFYFGKRKN
jgi:hypothetical protein